MSHYPTEESKTTTYRYGQSPQDPEERKLLEQARNEGFWLFGYGSLVWKIDFEVDDSKQGFIQGYKRRFWQGSPDHRGTDKNPGRVATVLPSDNDSDRVDGTVYKVSGEVAHQVMDNLLFREKAGYSLQWVSVHTYDEETLKAILFTATEDNEHFLGAADPLTIAKTIKNSVGPSGANVEYFNKLYESLKSRGIHDTHLEEIHEVLSQHASTNGDSKAR
eukprot:gb/GECG01009583.1/.p1 GENE.gb/GECG01009583.1/~~gb/GECG01009583.1/.p1  ORF type:complete len:219 (+),score=34.27 gb/GECG01009583.1/:1-657(+)